MLTQMRLTRAMMARSASGVDIDRPPSVIFDLHRSADADAADVSV